MVHKMKKINAAFILFCLVLVSVFTTASSVAEDQPKCDGFFQPACEEANFEAACNKDDCYPECLEKDKIPGCINSKIIQETDDLKKARNACSDAKAICVKKKEEDKEEKTEE